MSKGSFKSARNVGATRIKHIKKSGIKPQVDVEKIENLLQCLETGNLAPVKNYLKSKLPKKPSNRTKQTEEIAKEFRNDLIKNATPAEKAVKRMLKDLNIKFVFQKEMFYKRGKFYILDFYLPLNRIAIEIDGGYHNEDEQILKDKIREDIIKSKNINVIRFKNEQVFEIEFEEVLIEAIQKNTLL